MHTILPPPPVVAARCTAAASANPELVLPLAKGAPAVKSKAAPKGKARAKAEAPRRRYYAVTGGAPNDCDTLRLGVHDCQWFVLEKQLPGGKLFGSGCDLKGFDTPTEAGAHWKTAGWKLPAPFHEHPSHEYPMNNKPAGGGSYLMATRALQQRDR